MHKLLSNGHILQTVSVWKHSSFSLKVLPISY